MTIFCRNIERSLKLYRDILKFEIAEEKTVKGREMANMVALDDCVMRICHLRSHDSENGLIGLYEISGAEVTEAPRPTPGKIHYGQTALVVYTDQLSRIYAYLAADGYVFLTPPTKYVRNGTTEMVFYDPDGVLVSITGHGEA